MGSPLLLSSSLLPRFCSPELADFAGCKRSQFVRIAGELNTRHIAQADDPTCTLFFDQTNTQLTNDYLLPSSKARLTVRLNLHMTIPPRPPDTRDTHYRNTLARLLVAFVQIIPAFQIGRAFQSGVRI